MGKISLKRDFCTKSVNVKHIEMLYMFFMSKNMTCSGFGWSRLAFSRLILHFLLKGLRFKYRAGQLQLII